MNSMKTTRMTVIAMLLAGAAQIPHEARATDSPIPDSASPDVEASIPFANHGGIFDWRADGTRGIWLQDPSRKWYYGTFVSSCTGLDSADTVGFQTNPSGSFDHWSTVFIRNEIPCHLASFAESAGPPVAARDDVKEPAEAANNDVATPRG